MSTIAAIDSWHKNRWDETLCSDCVDKYEYSEGLYPKYVPTPDTETHCWYCGAVPAFEYTREVLERVTPSRALAKYAQMIYPHAEEDGWIAKGKVYCNDCVASAPMPYKRRTAITSKMLVTTSMKTILNNARDNCCKCGLPIPYTLTKRAAYVLFSQLKAVGRPKQKWEALALDKAGYADSVSNLLSGATECKNCNEPKKIAELGWRTEKFLNNKCVTCIEAEKSARLLKEQMAAIPEHNVTRNIDPNRTFGVELECGLPVNNEEFAKRMHAAGFQVVLGRYSQFDPKKWVIKTDSSVNCGIFSAEIASPPLKGIKGLTELRDAFRFFEFSGVKVNKTCGLHVHHSAKGLQVAGAVKLAKNYQKAQDAITKILPTWRAKNTYCVTLENRSLDGINSINSLQSATGRGAINFYNYSGPTNTGKNTVEFRQGAATIDFPMVEAWVILTQRMVLKVLKIQDQIIKKPVIVEAKDKEMVEKLLRSVGLNNKKIATVLANKMDARDAVPGFTGRR